MPSRSKNARAATLSPLAFFSLLRRGRTRRRAGSAKGKGRALGEALRKGKRGKLLGRIRRAHLRIAFGNARAPYREPRQSLRFGESLRGAGGSAPSHPFWRRGGLTATKQTASEKSPCAAGARGLFSLSRLREAAFSRHAIRLDGGEYSPPEPGLSYRFSSPRRGETPKAAGGHLHPLRGVPGQPRPGTGEGGAASGPIVAQMGNNRRSRRPRLRLDKTLTLFFQIYTIILVCYSNFSSMINHISEYDTLDTVDIFF